MQRFRTVFQNTPKKISINDYTDYCRLLAVAVAQCVANPSVPRWLSPCLLSPHHLILLHGLYVLVALEGRDGVFGEADTGRPC